MENIFTALIAYAYLVLFLLILYSKGELMIYKLGEDDE